MLHALTLPDSIEPDQLKTAAIVAIGVFAVVSFLVMRFIQKLVLKLIVVAVLVGAGVFLYTQRTDLDDCQRQLRDSLGRECVCGFAGFDVTVPGCQSLAPEADG